MLAPTSTNGAIGSLVGVRAPAFIWPNTFYARGALSFAIATCRKRLSDLEWINKSIDFTTEPLQYKQPGFGLALGASSFSRVCLYASSLG